MPCVEDARSVSNVFDSSDSWMGEGLRRGAPEQWMVRSKCSSGCRLNIKVIVYHTRVGGASLE